MCDLSQPSSLTQNSAVESGADRLSLHGVQLLAHGAVPGVWVCQQTECILSTQTHTQTYTLVSGHKECKSTASHKDNQLSTSNVYLHQQQTTGRGVEQITLYARNMTASLTSPIFNIKLYNQTDVLWIAQNHHNTFFQCCLFKHPPIHHILKPILLFPSIPAASFCEWRSCRTGGRAARWGPEALCRTGSFSLWPPGFLRTAVWSCSCHLEEQINCYDTTESRHVCNYNCTVDVDIVGEQIASI